MKENTKIIQEMEKEYNTDLMGLKLMKEIIKTIREMEKGYHINRMDQLIKKENGRKTNL